MLAVFWVPISQKRKLSLEVVKNTYSKPQASNWQSWDSKVDYEVARLPHASIRSTWRDLEQEALRSKGNI